MHEFIIPKKELLKLSSLCKVILYLLCIYCKMSQVKIFVYERKLSIKRFQLRLLLFLFSFLCGIRPLNTRKHVRLEKNLLQSIICKLKVANGCDTERERERERIITVNFH